MRRRQILRTNLIFILLFFASIACVRQAPQLPANKTNTVDSSVVAMQMANEKLISGEDSVIQHYVDTNALDFKKSNSGLWYKIYNFKNKSNTPSEGEKCQIDYQVFSLQNKLLFNETKSIIIGKKQIINGLEETLLLLSQGDSAVVLIPWYMGYGMKGNQYIPPYTSVVVHVKRL